MSKHIVKKVFIIIFLSFIVLCFILLLSQEKLFFHTSKNKELETLIEKEYNVRTITLYNKHNNKLTGKFYFNGNKENEKAPLIIYFSGNGETASRAFYGNYKSGLLDKLKGYNFLSINYPKFEDSEGSLTTENILEGSELFYQWAEKQKYVESNNINIIGYSMGTGPATYIAGKYPVHSLVLLAPYDNLISVYNANLPIFYGPLTHLAKYGIHSEEYAKLSKCTPLIIASKSDIVIKYKFSEKLSQTFPKIYKLVTLSDVRHEKIWLNDVTVKEIVKYYRTFK